MCLQALTAAADHEGSGAWALAPGAGGSVMKKVKRQKRTAPKAVNEVRARGGARAGGRSPEGARANACVRHAHST